MLCNSRTHSLRVLTTALVSICCLVQGEITQAEDDWTHSCARVLYTHNLPKSKNPWKKWLLMSFYKCGDCSWKVTCPGNRQYKLWNSNPKQPSHLCSFHYVIQLFFFSLSLFWVLSQSKGNEAGIYQLPNLFVLYKAKLFNRPGNICRTINKAPNCALTEVNPATTTDTRSPR